MARPRSQCRIPYKKFRQLVPGAKDTGFYAPWFNHAKRLVGKVTGLSGNQFVVHLLEMNEVLPPEKKLTDNQLAQEIAKEHPGSQISKCADPKAPQTVNALRMHYNLGKFDRWQVPPERMSFRYNENGIVVDFRSGRKVMTAEEIKRLIRIHTRARSKALLEEKNQKLMIREEQDKILRKRERIKEVKMKAIINEARKVKALRAQGFKVKKRPNREVLKNLDL